MQQVRQRLVGLGYEEALAATLVADAVGKDRKLCKRCLSWYRSTVARCAACASDLDAGR